MSQHPKVVEAATQCLLKHGVGSGGTRNIGGTGPYHGILERELADLHQKDSALVFSSCFVANDASLTALGQALPGCVIFSDKKNHASMIQGMRNSRCEKVVFEHNDLEDLREKLSRYPVSVPKIVAFESVYSMCGSISPMEAMCDLAHE